MLVAAAFAFGFCIPAIFFFAALTAVKFVVERDLPSECVAPHGADDTLGKARGAAGNIAPPFIEASR